MESEEFFEVSAGILFLALAVFVVVITWMIL